MHVVSFIIAFVILLAATLTALTGLVQLRCESDKAQNTLTAGFGLWLAGILIPAITFGLFSV